MDVVAAAIISGLFGVLTVVVGALAAKWSHEARKVGRSNAEELRVMATRIDSRQDKLIRSAVKEYVSKNPGIIDSAVAHEAMRDLLSELVALHLTPQEYDQIRHDQRRRMRDT
jgi:hypothetical protein